MIKMMMVLMTKIVAYNGDDGGMGIRHWLVMVMMT
jgi:hypothetical protein